MVHIIIYSAEAASPPPPVYMLVIEFEEVNFLPDTNLRRVPFGHALGHTLSQSVTALLIVQHSDGDSEIRRLMTMTRGAMFSVIKPDWSTPSGWLLLVAVGESSSTGRENGKSQSRLCGKSEWWLNRPL